jgi:hypothetical protein
MEIHHGKVERKNFREYLLEGLMIFIAVTLGFIAENLREYHNEKVNARQFLDAYKEELIQQQSLLERYKKIFQSKGIACDSLKNVFYNEEENKQLNVLERLSIIAMQNVDIPLNTSSYDQMVNSGALRYIENIALRDSMAAYKGQTEIIRNYNNRSLEIISNNTFEISKLIDLHDLVPLDTSGSNSIYQYTPKMKPFSKLSDEQRRSLVFFYEANIAVTQFNLRNIRSLYNSNLNIVKLVKEHLGN